MDRRIAYLLLVACGSTLAFFGMITMQSEHGPGGELPMQKSAHAAAPRAQQTATENRLEFAIALHGGSKSLAEPLSDEDRADHDKAVARALGIGVQVLKEGGTSLEAVEQVIRDLEDEPRFNAGRGAVLNEEGGHQMDASIMDGRTRACGAVANVRTVKNPISLAKLVMSETRHILLGGDGAERFAQQMGAEQVDPEYFRTERRVRQWKEYRETAKKPPTTGTVGCVALDRDGNLAAGTSTGGLTYKMFGRIGDSPIIGAGTYADNSTCAVSGTGIGEQFIRNAVAYDVSALMAYKGMSLGEAAKQVVHERLRPGDGGIIAVGYDGTLVAEFNTPGMSRGLADSTGRFEVHLEGDPKD